MLYGATFGTLELRQAGQSTRLVGRFPYGQIAVLSDGGRTGRPRKEKIAPNAFAYRINQPDQEIHLLAGHDYNSPLASRAAGSLDLTDSADAVSFEARISPEIAGTSYGSDLLAQLAAGLVGGISPGFRLPPARQVQNAETIEQEAVDEANGNYGALIRTVNDALLYELSIVTVPAYKNTTVEERSWALSRNCHKPRRKLLL
jgi:uncharacterized protein